MAAQWGTPISPATHEVIGLTAQLQGAAGIFLDTAHFEMFESISSIEQVVPGNGNNFIIKVHVSVAENGFIHMKTYMAPPINTQGPVITGIQRDKTRNDRIEPFE